MDKKEKNEKNYISVQNSNINEIQVQTEGQQNDIKNDLTAITTVVPEEYEKAVRLTREKVKIHETINFDKEPLVPVKVSIVVPVCNVEQYLRECLDSCVNQTLKEIEIICVNDGSTDSCLNILKEYAAKDDRVKVIDKDNAGYGHTMNIGMDMAKGEYIGIVESDDFVELNMYEELYNIAISQGLDIIKSDFCRFTHDPKGIIKKDLNRVAARAPELYNVVTSAFEDQRVFHLVMQTWSGIYRKGFLDEHNIRHNETPGASYQDNGFWFQTFMFAQKVYFYDKPFYMNRRDNPNSSVHNKGKVYCMNEEYRFIREIMLQNPTLYDEYKYEYSRKKFANYLFTYNRIGDEFKWEYLLAIQAEIHEAEENGEINWELFDKLDSAKLRIIAETPGEFFRQELKKEIAETMSSEVKRLSAEKSKHLVQISNYKAEIQTVSQRLYKLWKYKCKKRDISPSKLQMNKLYQENLQKNAKVHVAFITDDNYCMPTAVAITSLKINRNKETDYYIHIITNNVSDYNKEKLKRLSDINDNNFKIDIINVQLENIFSGISKKDKDLHVSASAVIKLQLPQILEDVGKVLYVDGDVLIQRDLLELYNTNINNKYAAVVKDIISERNPKHMKNLNIKNEFYFNSGMMLLNLSKMRKDDMTKKLINYRLTGKNHFVDQDTLNVVFSERVVYVSWQYNYLNKFHDWWDSERLSLFYGEIVPENKIKAFENAAILHLGSHEKPWLYDMGYLSKLYMKYYTKSPYGEIKLELEKIPVITYEYDRLIKVSDNESLTEESLVEKLTWNRLQKQKLEKLLKLAEGNLNANSYEVYSKYREQQELIENLSKKLDVSNSKLNDTRNSVSFKIGRLVTWFPRKIRSLFKKK